MSHTFNLNQHLMSECKKGYLLRNYYDRHANFLCKQNSRAHYSIFWCSFEEDMIFVLKFIFHLYTNNTLISSHVIVYTRLFAYSFVHLLLIKALCEYVQDLDVEENACLCLVCCCVSCVQHYHTVKAIQLFACACSMLILNYTLWICTYWLCT